MKDTIIYLSIFSPLIHIFLGIYWYKKLTIHLKILLAVLLHHQAFEGLTVLFIYLYKSNKILLPFYNFIDLTALTLILLMLLKIKRKVLITALIDLVYILFVILDEYLINQSKIILHANSGIYTCLVLIVLVLVLFYSFMLNITGDGITRQPNLWMGTGILFYSSFSILIYIYFMHFEKFDKELIDFSITIKAFGNILANGLFIVAFYMQKNKKIERNLYY